MNYQKLKDACGDDEADFAYSSEVVRRLQRVLGDQLSMTESVALMKILRVFTFRYQDGFIINDIHDSVKIMGFSDAAAIVATFWDDPQLDWEWFKTHRWSIDTSSPEYKNVGDHLTHADFARSYGGFSEIIHYRTEHVSAWRRATASGFGTPRGSG